MMQTLKRICAVLCVMMVVGVGCSDSSSDDTSENSGADTDMTAEADTGTGMVDTSTEVDSGEADTGTDSPDTMADAPDEEGPSTWPLDEDGPYRVGFRSWEVTYSSPADGSDRTVVLNLWYPTEATTGEPAIYLGVFAFTDEEVLTDAPPAPPVHEGGYPVLVHSHGHLGFGGVSADLMRHMASHGWVAAAPDHTDNTLSDGQEPKPTSIFIHRPTDISAVLDTLEGLPAEDPLAGQMQTDKALLTGHSFGVYTIWSAGGAALDVEGLRSVCGPGTDTAPFSNWEASCTEQELEAFEAGLGSCPSESVLSVWSGAAATQP
ncbi:MAG: hypothetical protein AAFX99_25850, partial [Myxococcota bacterium]